MSGQDSDPLVGAILVGGVSHRMGRDKALVEIGGISLAEWVRRSLAEVASPVLVVGKNGERHPLPDLPFVGEDCPARCSLAGLVAALSAAPDDRVIVVGCDHPFLSPDLLRALAKRGDRAVRVAGRGGGLEPLLGCWDAPRALPVLSRRLQDGALSLYGALRELSAEVLPEIEARALDPDLRSFVNVNTPEDLARARCSLEKY